MAGMDPGAIATMSMQRMDKNGDSLLTEDELPEQMRANFATNDKNGDKQLDTAELTAAIAKRMNRQGGGPPGPGGASQAAAPSGGGAGL